jgi:enamine deaminase RidA (YjgF/YER057c/UK114 family)
MAAAKTHIFSGSIYEEMAGYARAVVVGDHIFVSGTVGVDFASGTLADGAEAQTRQALQTIENALNEAGASLADIVRVRVYIPNPDDVMAVSGVLKEKIGSGYPANTTVCAPLAVPGALVEIESEAIRGCGSAN